MFEFRLHDYIAAVLSAGSVFTFIILLIYNGYDDFRKGRNTSTWRKQI